jgi:hypothetical protein
MPQAFAVERRNIKRPIKTRTGMSSLPPDVLTPLLDNRLLSVVIAGSNGAGKTSFYRSFLQHSGLRFVNADILAARLNLAPYDAASLAGSVVASSSSSVKASSSRLSSLTQPTTK